MIRVILALMLFSALAGVVWCPIYENKIWMETHDPVMSVVHRSTTIHAAR